MYFLPILLAITAFLIYPSLLLAAGVGILTFAYFTFGGERLAARAKATARGQIAYRMLSVKILAMNGEIDENTYHAHALVTPDEAETSELRGQLRDAAATTGQGWKELARRLRYIYDAETLVDRLDILLVQLNAQPGPITPETEQRIIEIAKIWKIGPNTLRKLMNDSEIQPGAAISAWK